MRLPKTAHRQILRGTMRKIADSEPYVAPSTSTTRLPREIEDALKKVGYAK